MIEKEKEVTLTSLKEEKSDTIAKVPEDIQEKVSERTTSPGDNKKPKVKGGHLRDMINYSDRF